MAPSVRGKLARHAKPGHPHGDEGVSARASLHVPERDGFNPAGHPVNHGEQVPATITCCGQRANEVHVHVEKPLARHGDWLEVSGRLLCHFGALAILAVSALGEHVPIHALPDDTCRHETAGGTYTWVSQLVEGGKGCLAMGDGYEGPGLRQADITKHPDVPKLDQLKLHEERSP